MRSYPKNKKRYCVNCKSLVDVLFFGSAGRCPNCNRILCNMDNRDRDIIHKEDQLENENKKENNL
jgi:hypothetical protein